MYVCWKVSGRALIQSPTLRIRGMKEISPFRGLRNFTVLEDRDLSVWYQGEAEVETEQEVQDRYYSQRRGQIHIDDSGESCEEED